MFSGWYAKWMTDWETELTTRDTNRIVRPLEWGFDWLGELSERCGAHFTCEALLDPGTADGAGCQCNPQRALKRMIALNQEIARRSDEFYSYTTPTDFRLELRYPELFQTNVRPETLAQDAEMRRKAAAGEIQMAEFLRFTSPVRTIYPENDQVNARWYPAPAEKQAGKPKQAIIVMPQWNADALSHNALCQIFNKFGVSGLRLSKPYHDIRRPPELERSDYAMSANVGRTISACRQAVADIRSCIDWLETQGYTQFGLLGTSIGSCYAYIAAAHDPRIRVCAFNHASTYTGDVAWAGQSTRHVRAAFAEAGLTQDDVRAIWLGLSPMAYIDLFAAHPKRVLVVHARYDLTFPLEYSLDVLKNFERLKVDYVSRVLPCGHYTTGETPYKYIDGWYLGSFVYSAFKRLREGPQ